MTGRFRIGIAAAVALLLTASGLLRLLAAGTWIWPVVGAIIASTAAGELARRLIRPRPLVIVAQILAVFWYDMVLLAHKVAFGGVLPTWAAFHRLGELYRQGAADINHTVPGDPSTAGIAAILVLSLGALAVLVDALAATYAVAPLAGLPLLALYLVPATRVGGGMDWLAFTVSAAGYTALLSAEGRDRLGRWGRPLIHAGTRRPAADGNGNGESAPRARVDTGPIAATGHQITMLALVAAVLAPVLLPTVSSGLFGLGPSGSGGSGDGAGDSTELSQVLDLRANLASQTEQTVLTYTTSDGRPQYVRLAAFDDFHANGKYIWTPQSDAANQQMLPPGVLGDSVPGFKLDNTATPPITTHIKYVSGIPSKVPAPPNQPVLYSVPAPYPAESLTKPAPDWVYNPDTLAVSEQKAIKKNFEYDVTSFDVTKNISKAQYQASAQLSQDQLGKRGLAKDVDTSEIPPEIAAAARQVVDAAKAKTPIDQARAIQAYFKDSKHFTYSLKDVPAQPTGKDALLWLLNNRSGYCQYYATGMATMARTLGIPARVAIGFTGGQKGAKGGDANTYTVTTHDFHLWPELYFDGIGWLRFEPTVGIEVSTGGTHGNVPLYTLLDAAPNPAATASSQASGPQGGPSSSATDHCTAAQRKAGDCPDQNTGGSTASNDKFGYLGWFGAVPRFFDYWLFGGSVGAVIIRFVLLLLFLIGCVPMVLRMIRRRGRMSVTRRRTRGKTTNEVDALEWESAEDRPVRPTDDPERLRILAAWAEIHDSATDLGYPWPVSETPRQTAERIIKQARFSRSAQDAMDRVTGLTEHASYARTIRPGTAPTTLFDDVRTIRGGLAEPVSRRTRIRATVLPPSAMAALRERREDLTGRVYERVQGAGARLRPRRGPKKKR